MLISNLKKLIFNFSCFSYQNRCKILLKTFSRQQKLYWSRKPQISFFVNVSTYGNDSTLTRSIILKKVPLLPPYYKVELSYEKYKLKYNKLNSILESNRKKQKPLEHKLLEAGGWYYPIIRLTKNLNYQTLSLQNCIMSSPYTGISLMTSNIINIYPTTMHGITHLSPEVTNIHRDEAEVDISLRGG